MNNNFAQLQDFADKLPYALIVLNQNYLINWWNQQATTLLHLNDAMRNKAITTVITHPAFLDYVNNLDFSQRIEIALKPRDELFVSIEIIVYPSQGYLLHVQDITHLHRLEIMRRDFVANVSHELRTPLTVIHGYLETLIEHDDASLANWKKLFRAMQQQSIRMETLVKDLLLLTRLETCHLQPQDLKKIDITKLLHDIYHDATALSAQQHVIELNVETQASLFGNYDELRSAFSNLVFNAIHYTPAQGKIIIRWFASHDTLCLTVHDTGIGIAAEHIPRLTERFYRVDPGRSRAYGGTGLGLAIVKHVLLRHNAHLHIESEPGVGSKFRCEFKASANKH